jgi:hypothetical protein
LDKTLRTSVKENNYVCWLQCPVHVYDMQ